MTRDFIRLRKRTKRFVQRTRQLLGKLDQNYEKDCKKYLNFDKMIINTKRTIVVYPRSRGGNAFMSN